MTVPLLRVCYHCGYPTPGRHASSCRDAASGVVEVAKPLVPAQVAQQIRDVAAQRDGLAELLKGAVEAGERYQAEARGLRQELDEARAERDRLLDVYRKAEVFVDATAKAEHMPVGAWAALAAAVDLAARSATPDAEPAPRVWHLPPEPGLEVTRVVDTYGQHFERQHDEHPGDDVWIGTTFGDWADVDDLVLEWGPLMAYHAPLTDATPEPAPGVPVDTITEGK